MTDLTASADNIIEGDIDFQGRSRDIIGLVIKNMLLNIITLGFYRFWARTNVRRYLWEKMQILGTPLEYTGTGKELFVGFLLIVFVVFVPYAILNVALEASGYLQNASFLLAYNIAIAIAFFYLIGVATYRARRYRLARTRWRSVRAGQTGSSWFYGMWFVFLNYLMVFFGLITPYKNMKLWRMRIENTHVGDKFFVFDGEGESRGALGHLYKSFIAIGLLGALVYFGPLFAFGAAVGSIPGIGDMQPEQVEAQVNIVITDGLVQLGDLIWLWWLMMAATLLGLVWYKLRETRVLVGLTSFEGLKLNFDASVWAYFKLALGNLLLVIFSLGFGLPFTQVRWARFIANHTEVEGGLDLATIAQSLDDELTSGEGLADAFDMGAV